MARTRRPRPRCATTARAWAAEAGDDQLSLFAVISATATGTDDATGRSPHDDEEPDEEDDDLLVELPALAGAGSEMHAGDPHGAQTAAA